MSFQALGQVVGGFFGGAWGAAIGGMAGAYLDNKQSKPRYSNTASSKNFSTTNEGPKLSPGAITSSQYGDHINEHWGTTRTSGSIIWATEIKETEIITNTDYTNTYTQQTPVQNGKRQEIQVETITETTTVSNITYTYHVDLAILIGKGKYTKLRRMWIDGQLVLDYGTKGSSGGYLRTAGKKQKGGCFNDGHDFKFDLYLGFDDQEVDPLIQSIEGEYPAHNGYCYIVFKGMCVDKYGARIPNIEFEMIKDDDIEFISNYEDVSLLSEATTTFNGIQNNIVYDNLTDCYYVFKKNNTHAVLLKINNDCSEILGMCELPIDPFSSNSIDGSSNYSNENYDLTIDHKGNIIIFGGFEIVSSNVVLKYYSIDTKDMVYKEYSVNTNLAFNQKRIESIFHKNYYLARENFSNNAYIRILTIDDPGVNSISPRYLIQENYTLNNYNYSFENNVFCSDKYIQSYDIINLLYYTFTKTGILNLAIGQNQQCIIANENGVNYTTQDMFLNPDDECIYIKYKKSTDNNNFYVAKVNRLTAALEDTFIINIPNLNCSDKMFFNIQQQIFTTFYVNTNDELIALQFDLTDNTLYEEKIAEDYGFSFAGNYNGYEITYNSIDNYFVLSKYNDSTKNVLLQKIFTGRYGRSTSNLKEIVDHYCLRSGLTLNDIYTDELNQDQVRGYNINGGSNAQSIIEHLAYAFNFGVYESQGKIKFVKYDTAKNNIITINNKTIGCQQLTEDAEFSNILSIERNQDTELPKFFTLEYNDYERDYEIGLQQSRYIDTKSENIQSNSLPIVLTAQEAKNIVEKNIYLAYTQRDFFELQTNYDYIDLEPLDIIKFTYDCQEYILRINRVESQNGIIKISGTTQEETENYNYFDAVESEARESGINVISQSDFILLDLPALNNNDLLDFGFYYTAYPTSQRKWKGSQLLESKTSDLNNLTRSSITFAPIKFGKLTYFNNYFNTNNDTNNIDYASEINVKIYFDKELNNCTFEDLLNYKNLLLIGNEIIQFKNAELIDNNNTYRLTQLLRARLDTEDYSNNHVLNEQVILLEQNTIKNVYRNNIEDINIQKYYQSLSIGNNYSRGLLVRDFTNTGNRAKCFKVSNVNYNKDALNNISITFNKKARGIISFNNDYDIDNDNYKIKIYSDNTYTTLLNTYNFSNTNEFIYTETMNINDFSTFNNNIFIEIIKMNIFNQEGKAKRINIIV